ncbi:MAG TPA: D-alanine--D-alanine ligase [Actinomycetota bacterium]|nr:D-alanine--D-alanine ligase [Actinomycetota bacterium]
MTRIAVLAGGLSPERDVSIRSGRRVADALRAIGEEVAVHDTDAELLPEWETDPPDCVIPLLHGAVGEDGSLRDVLDTIGLPYVGARPSACRLAFDKPIAKSQLAEQGVSTPDWIALPHSTFRELGAQRIMSAAIARLGLPLVVKPARGGSALGLAVVRSADELPPAMVAAFAYGETVLLESFAAGIEIAVSVIESPEGTVALPAVEIHSDSGLYDYQARYTAGMTEFFSPARLSQADALAAAETALTAHRTFGIRHLSRTDLIVAADGTPQFLETNVAPGMTETSLLPQSVAAAGLELGTVMATLVRQATGED